MFGIDRSDSSFILIIYLLISFFVLAERYFLFYLLIGFSICIFRNQNLMIFSTWPIHEIFKILRVKVLVVFLEVFSFNKCIDADIFPTLILVNALHCGDVDSD